MARELSPDVLPYVVGTQAAHGFVGFNTRTQSRRTTSPEAMLSRGHQHGRALRVHAMGVKNRCLALVGAGTAPL